MTHIDITYPAGCTNEFRESPPPLPPLSTPTYELWTLNTCHQLSTVQNAPVNIINYINKDQ